MTSDPGYFLDAYCATSCESKQCSPGHDCRTLQFRRRAEVGANLDKITSYVLNLHAPVSAIHLARRFFVNDRRTRALDGEGRQYLENDFARLLSSELLRRGQLVRHNLADGRVAWSSRNASSNVPEADEFEPEEIDLNLDTVVTQVLKSTTPMSLRDLSRYAAPRGVEAVFIEARLSGLLRAQAGVRCVFIDSKRGLGTYWASEKWLRENLPSSFRLRTIPDDAFDRKEAAGYEVAADETEDEDSEEAEEAEEGAGATKVYTAKLDDVVSGSIVLAAQDHDLFPLQPNPVWIAVHDEEGCRYDTLVISRGHRREIHGLRLLFVQHGTGFRFRLKATNSPHSFYAEARGYDEGAAELDRDTRLPRRLWRYFLERSAHEEWLRLEAIATDLETDRDKVTSALLRYSCFEQNSGKGGWWRLNASQARLERHSYEDEEIDHEAEVRNFLSKAFIETQLWRVKLRNMRSTLDELEQRMEQIGGRQ